MESSVLRSLQRIRKEAPRRFKDFRALCDDMISELAERESNGSKMESNADDYFEAFQLACESRHPRLMDVSLDAIHYLMEHGYLRGSKSIPSVPTAKAGSAGQPPRRSLMDLVIETVSKCSDEVDENVQLQVIKVLLTAVTSAYCEVHEASLLQAVRSCFHIHLVTKNQVNRTTAKAALTQMLSVVNARMEHFEAQSKAKTKEALSAMGRTMTENGSRDDLDDQAAVLMEDVEEGEAATHGDNETDTKKELDGALADSKRILSVNSVSITQEEFDGSTLHSAAGVASQGPEGDTVSLSFPSIMHKDAFLIFRALCKLSMKGIYDDEETGTDSSDHVALQNKILSLELVLHILQHCGPAFRTGERFVYAIQHYLCVSLLGNCTSQVNQITGLSLQVFVALMDSFKDHLKAELEVFVTNIFLRIMESENSSFDHKMRVLEVFQIICKEPSGLIEIFINYDCDLEAIDLFRRMVDGFAKIVKNPGVLQGKLGVDFIASVSAAGKRAQAEEQALRIQSLGVLVTVLQSLLRSAGFPQTVDDERPNTPREKEKERLASPKNGGSSAAVPSSGSKTDVTDAGDDFSMSSKPAVAAESVTSNSAVELFDRKQRRQEELETGILKFNMSPKKGLTYLADRGHIVMNPQSVASFLLQYQDRLDKTMIGEYLGRERDYQDGFCLQVLHEYVDSLDFTNMAFDLAIRHFLAGFRLPGEAQKIDRIMEKFAERYYLLNRDTFVSADMAFILAFSTIMLQTNLHNPAIKEEKKMTKEQFLKQNKGISSEGELPEQMLSEIYDRIAAEPISMTSGSEKKAPLPEKQGMGFFQVSADRKKKDAFSNERREMVKAGEALFKLRASRKNSAFVRTQMQIRNEDEYTRPMFEVVWAPVLGVISQILEVYDESETIQMSLHCFELAIRLASRLDVPMARRTYINTLAKFTTLDSVREMKQKNVDSIRVLLEISLTEGDYLEESWTQVLQTISQLSRLQLFGNGLHTDDTFFSEPTSVSSDATSKSIRRFSREANGGGGFGLDSFTKLFSGPTKAETVRIVEEGNAGLVLREIEPALIDKIFLSSQSMSEESVLHFVRSLCEVSQLEIATTSTLNTFRGKGGSSDTANPRVFSLQKLVEVADYNMGSRGRIAWASIWNLLAAHFTNIGTRDNLALAMYAIDSLKQLSIKFLLKEELSNFNFQRLFLKPFEVIISQSKSVEIKDLVLRVLSIMIQACATNIRSGWKSIFVIFEQAAMQESPEIANIAFEITERLLTTRFQLLIFDFVELQNCLVTFVGCAHTALSLRALAYLAKCADHLANGSISPALESPAGAGSPAEVVLVNAESQINEDASVFRLWFPLLLGLSTKVADPRLAVRMRALETLAAVLRAYGNMFSPQTWGVIFKGVLFPMIDTAQIDSTAQPKSRYPTENIQIQSNSDSWIGTMALPVFKISVEMYQLFKEKADEVNLLPELMAMLEDYMLMDMETLARLGVSVYSDLIISLGRSPDGKPQRIDSSTAHLVSCRLSKALLASLSMDFSENGELEIASSAPASVAELVSAGALVARRHGGDEDEKDGPAGRTSHQDDEKEGVGSTFSTPFGLGILVGNLMPVHSLGIGARNAVQLTWGATLYTKEPLVPCHSSSSSSSSSSRAVSNDSSQAKALSPCASASASADQRAADRLPWARLAGAVMTSMVVSLDFIRLTGDVLNVHYADWQLTHLSRVLAALEASHWHARSFNENLTLRKALHAQSFMHNRNFPQRLPHLLEQEIQTVSLILGILARLSTSSEGQSPESLNFVEPWTERICASVCRRYISLEAELQPGSGGNDSNIDLPLVVDSHVAYTAIVIRVLKEVGASVGPVSACTKLWIVPLLPQLILCDDKNVRHWISEIHRIHLNPMLMQGIE